jgi:ABC-type multidrug transport system fused ATPase/permease subunit
LDLQLHRRSIGVVTQDCVLFDGTILDNIMFGSSRRRGQVSAAERHEAIRAAELAHADIFVREFVQGYDTPVGEGGVQLSGGEL